MAILAGTKIQAEVEAGNITIDPFEPKHLNPASVDLTLGPRVAVYEDHTECYFANEWDRARENGQKVGCHPPQPGMLGDGPYFGAGLRPINLSGTPHRRAALDTKKGGRLREWEIDPEVGWMLMPGVGYLMHTVERVTTDKYVPVLDGKSSLGRLFISVHVTAGYGDPGFDGQYTLEVTCQFPVIVYPGMRICQMRFHHIDGEPVSYQKLGHYVGDKAVGPVGSVVRETSFDG